jgi:cation transport ATPase
MFLDLTKALSFFACIVVVYHAAINTLFVPGAKWEERLALALLKLALAACVSFLSGMVFTFPTRTNPDRGLALTATLPVRFFFWSASCIVVLFLSSWYFSDLVQQAAPFISSRTLQRF